MERTPRETPLRKRWSRSRLLVLGLAALLLVVALSTIAYGLVSHQWFGHTSPQSDAQVASATGASALSPTAPSPIATKPSATLTPTPPARPTAAATPTPAGPLPTLWVFQVVLAPKNCSQVSGGWACRDIIGNTGLVPLAWKARSTMAGATITPSSGTLAPGQQRAVSLVLPCVHAGTIYFIGPANQVAVSWGCYVNGALP